MVANGILSSSSVIKSGVPQGIVLGPVLFLLIIDSICDIDPEAKIFSFANDSKLSVKIYDEKDIIYMQNCIEKLDI